MPRYTLVDAATNLHRLDGTFWAKIVSHGPEDVHLLAAPGTMSRFGETASAERIRHVLRFARNLYDVIVVDLGPATPVSMNVTETMNRLMLVSTDELPALFECSRLLKRLSDSGMKQGRRVDLVVNRCKATGGSSSEIEKAIGYTVLASISDHSTELREAAGPGEMVKRTLKLRKQVEKVVAKHLGVEETKPSRSTLAFLRF